MIAVIFEVWPADGERDHYLDIAADLLPLLREIDGFISVERFQCITEPGKMLSLSFWRDEEAIAAWRAMDAHRAAQMVGRESVFRDYRLRVAHILRDYSLDAREEAPADSRQAHG